MLLVIIVNYRTPGLVSECLRSLRGEIAHLPGTKVVVVDNHSADDSAAVIEQVIVTEQMAAWSTLVRAPRNGGFAYGNLVGLQAAIGGSTPFGILKPTYVWLLNPDTYVRPGAMTETVRFLHGNPQAGIAGTGIENTDGSSWLSAFRFPTIWSEIDSALAFGPFTRLIGKRAILYPPAHAPRRVEWVSGASLFIRFDVLERIGFLDTEYFMYFEETDYCLRAHRRGIECWQIPASRVVHIQGASSGGGGRKVSYPPYWFASRARYFRKNHGRLYLVLANLLWCSLYPIGTLQRWLRGKARADRPRLWRDMVRFSLLGSIR